MPLVHDTQRVASRLIAVMDRRIGMLHNRMDNRIQVGTVTAVSTATKTCSVDFGAGTSDNIRYSAVQAPAVNDRVRVMLESGGHRWIVDNLTGTGPTYTPPPETATSTYNVLDYGAIGDGVANDTAAIQSAVDAAAADGGGIVYFPAMSFMATHISLKSRVQLVGSGWDTNLRQIGGSNRNFIVLADVNVILTRITNLAIFGNKGLQTSGSAISYVNSGGSFWFGDSVHIIENVFISDVKESGVVLDVGVREARVTDVYVNGADLHGFDITSTDSVFVGITSGSAGGIGIRVLGNNNRFTTCKAFGSGRVTTAIGDGFYITGNRNTFSSCEAQDNRRHGWVLYDVVDVALSGCVADSNGVGTAGSGFRLDLATNNILSGCNAYNRTATLYQQYGIELTSTAQKNVINLYSRDHALAPINPGGGLGNSITTNGTGGLFTATFAASFTPNPYLGNVVGITLSGNITINEPAHPFIGQVLTFNLQQDGTGGRTVTFNSIFKTSWSPSTTAWTRNMITFLYNGTHWVQQSAATGVAG